MTGVVLVMVFLHLSPQFFIMLPYYRTTRSFSFEQLVRVLGIFNVLVAYMYITYYQAVTSDAGGVPPRWTPDEAMAEYGVELSSEHRRFCYKCNAFKPPRAHHCKQCKRCVLRMDHHCPWIGNCVGNGNHAHFMRFITALTIAGTYLLAMLCLRVVDWWNTDWYFARPSTSEVVMLVLNYLVGIPPILLTSIMMWYQIYLLAINNTTIETHELDRVMRQIRRGQIPFTEFPFDVGVWRNYTEIFGSNILLWPWPFSKPVHDGLLYPVSADERTLQCSHPAEVQFLWPPPDPRARQRRRHDLPDSAFTYGDEQLNPALQPSNAAELARHAQHSLNGSPGAEDEDEEFDFSPRVRVRRGSEGLEVRPPQYSRMFLADPAQESSSGDAPYGSYLEYGAEAPTATEKSSPKIIDVSFDEDEIPLGHLVRRHTHDTGDPIS